MCANGGEEERRRLGLDMHAVGGEGNSMSTWQKELGVLDVRDRQVERESPVNNPSNNLPSRQRQRPHTQCHVTVIVVLSCLLFFSVRYNIGLRELPFWLVGKVDPPSHHPPSIQLN